MRPLLSVNKQFLTLFILNNGPTVTVFTRLNDCISDLSGKNGGRYNTGAQERTLAIQVLFIKCPGPLTHFN